MKNTVFRALDSLPVLSLMEDIKTARNSTDVLEDTAMWFVPYFIWEPVKAAWSHQVTAKNMKEH